MVKLSTARFAPRRLAPGIRAALLAALLFGITTPLAKVLLARTGPLLLAGLLYAGSGLGLTLLRLLRDGRWRPVGLARGEGGWLAGAVLCGGILAPALLMIGLARTTAATASLLLNLEVVFTALLAWLAFREATGRRAVLGLLAIFAGGLALALPAHWADSSGASGAALVAAACCCWGLDNNLTRRISAADASGLAAIKGLAAGAVNITLAFLAAGVVLPTASRIGAALALGFLGYGVSLTLFIVALRELGAARASAYFATAPFIGAAVAVLVFGRAGGADFWAAAAAMALGVWLQATEHHEHEHVHAALTHSHSHRHDEHHRHAHGSEWDGREPHTHPHRHEELRHSHGHFPDIHHQHSHD
jgi:drug/metabolite transporter (DMT)-like permease